MRLLPSSYPQGPIGPTSSLRKENKIVRPSGLQERDKDDQRVTETKGFQGETRDETISPRKTEQVSTHFPSVSNWFQKCLFLKDLGLRGKGEERGSSPVSFWVAMVIE